MSELVEICRTLVKSALQRNLFFISQPKHMLWVLNETVLLSTQNLWVRKYLQFYADNFCLSKPVNMHSVSSLSRASAVGQHVANMISSWSHKILNSQNKK